MHLFAGASFHVNRFGLTTACLRVVPISWLPCWRSCRWLRSQLKQLIVDADRFIYSVFETMWASPPCLSHNIPRMMARLLYEVRPGSATRPQYSIDIICYDLVCDALKKKYSHGVSPDQRSRNAWRSLGDTREPLSLESAITTMATTFQTAMNCATKHIVTLYAWSHVRTSLNEHARIETNVYHSRDTRFGCAPGRWGM